MASHADALKTLYRRSGAQRLSEEACVTAKMGILDVVGCIVAGAASEAAASVLDFVRDSCRPGGSVVFGTRDRLPPQFAALANGVAGHVLDYDDMNSTMINHPSVVLVPVIMALAEARGNSGREILDAYVLGLEVDCHFGRAMNPKHYETGWHATSSLGIFGAAAAGSRLLRLDDAQMLNALGIAASSAAGIRANFGSMTKSLHAGHAAEGGLRAALLTARGFTANADVFDAQGGYFDTYGKMSNPKPAPLAPEIESSGIGIKPYPCCGAGVTLIDVTLDLKAGGLSACDEIVSVECLVSEMAHMIMPYTGANDGLQAKYSLPYCVAVALLDGRAGIAQFEDERVRREDVQAFMQRIKVTADPRMAAGRGRFGVEMTVRFRNGSTRRASTELPRGHPERPLESLQLSQKFLECAGPVLGEERASDVVAMIHSMERLSSVSPLVALLAKGEN